MGSPKVPTPTNTSAAAQTVAPAPPQLPSAEVQQANSATQAQAASANGVRSTIITGPQGLPDNSTNTAVKTLTGQ